jgi:putative nucleotidyltransferase with HDIG domain
MTDAGTSGSLVSLSEVLSALSYALDLTEGQPEGHAVRSCLIGMRIGEALALDAESRSALYYALILKDAGCSSTAARVAALFGADDGAVKRELKLVDWSRPVDGALYGIRAAGAGRPLATRLRHVATLARAGVQGARGLVRTRCERGAEIARRLGFPEATAEAMRAVDEHWDGRGYPDGLRGRDIPLLARIAGVAQTADAFLMARGVDAAMRVVRVRRGTWFDPDLADAVLSWQGDQQWWDTLRTPEAMRLVLDAEPAGRERRIDEPGLDEVAAAFAGIIDAKTPFTYRHSTRVATYARDIAADLGMDAEAARQIYRAGLLHDIGKLGVSNRILEKPGSLTSDEWRVVKQHPVYTWAILDRVRVFRPIARTAALHHERLDGSGYPWGLDGAGLEPAARILAVADAYEAMTSWRPYCAPVPPDTAIFLLDQEGGTRLDAHAVGALRRCLAHATAGASDELGTEYACVDAFTVTAPA